MLTQDFAVREGALSLPVPCIPVAKRSAPDPAGGVYDALFGPRIVAAGDKRSPPVHPLPSTLFVSAVVMQLYIVQTIYRVDIGHIVSYRYRQEKYRHFDISLSFRYRFNIGETTPAVCYPIVCIFTRLSGDYGRLAYLCRPD